MEAILQLKFAVFVLLAVNAGQFLALLYVAHKAQILWDNVAVNNMQIQELRKATGLSTGWEGGE